MKSNQLDEVAELLTRIPPIMHRKIHRYVFKATFTQAGEDISLHHLIILKELQIEGPLHLSEIGDIIGISKPQMTHSTDKLFSLGMIERQPDAHDRRKINILLTQKGRDTLEKLEKIIRSRIKERLSALSDDELEKLTQSFKYIKEAFSKLE